MVSKENKDFFVGLFVFFVIASILNFSLKLELLLSIIIALLIAVPSALIFDKLTN